MLYIRSVLIEKCGAISCDPCAVQYNQYIHTVERTKRSMMMITNLHADKYEVSDFPLEYELPAGITGIRVKCNRVYDEDSNEVSQYKFILGDVQLHFNLQKISESDIGNEAQIVIEIWDTEFALTAFTTHLNILCSDKGALKVLIESCDSTDKYSSESNIPFYNGL